MREKIFFRSFQFSNSVFRSRHGRACPGHPRLGCSAAVKAGMPATSAGMTEYSRDACASEASSVLRSAHPENPRARGTPGTAGPHGPCAKVESTWRPCREHRKRSRRPARGVGGLLRRLPGGRSVLAPPSLMGLGAYPPLPVQRTATPTSTLAANTERCIPGRAARTPGPYGLGRLRPGALRPAPETTATRPAPIDALETPLGVGTGYAPYRTGLFECQGICS